MIDEEDIHEIIPVLLIVWSLLLKSIDTIIPNRIITFNTSKKHYLYTIIIMILSIHETKNGYVVTTSFSFSFQYTCIYIQCITNT